MSQEEILQVVPYTLREIYIQKSQLRMADGFDPTQPGQALHGKFRIVGVQISAKETKELMPGNNEGNMFRSCTFATRFEFRYIRAAEDGAIRPEAEEEAHLVAEITADIATDYLIGVPEMPSHEDLQKWGTTNVLLHVWPYWREYCHDAMMRMRLPVSIMPLFQLNPSKPLSHTQPARQDP